MTLTRAVRDRIRPPRIDCGLLMYCSHGSVTCQKRVWLLNHHYHIVIVFHFSYLRDPEADKFRNLISYSFSTDTSVVTFSLRSVQYFLWKVANRQTDLQTDRQTKGIR